MVLVVAEDGVQAVTGFQDASMLQAFGLPKTLAQGLGHRLSPARGTVMARCCVDARRRW
jgi:hypothetical protein